ncbi:reverse transcriptase domain-containing protein [Tanacetum coccineum]|uniref:Reverse transcriptase domain-containing protein n=1 Tax=Tanacetum coccineum TaxID=301880 RepID=A0ABQ4XQS0_9ASTR
MAVVFALDKFRSYLILSKTIVHTDHSALKHLFKKQDAKPRLIRWILIDNNESSDDSEVDNNFPGQTLMEIDTRNEPRYRFMGPFSKSHKFEYILVAVNYVSKWAEAQALPTNDARVVITFLKKLFCRFRMPKALISDRGTHFCNKIMEKTMKRYEVNHHFSTSYHPQTSGQVENTNRALKSILEKTVKDNPVIWSRKLDDALWAFRTAYKTPTSTTPYKLIYGKKTAIYHLKLNTVHTRHLRIAILISSLLARTKVWHDSKLRMRKEFKHGNNVLLFHSKYKFKQPKLISCWLGPYVVKHQYPSGYVELYGKDGKTFIVNSHRLKLYHEEEDYNDQREAVTPFFPKE